MQSLHRVEKSPSSDGTGSIMAGDLSTQSIMRAFSICPIPTCISARDDDVGERHWTRLRREGSEGSKSSKSSKGGGGALRAQIIKKPARALRHFDESRSAANRKASYCAG